MWSILRGGAGIYVLLLMVWGCGDEESTFDPGSVVCSDVPIAVVVRLDYLSLELKGYTAFIGEGSPLALADAPAAAGEAFGLLAPTLFKPWGGGVWFYGADAFVPREATPPDGDVIVLAMQPGDFGGLVLMDRRTGAALLVAEVIHGGDGEILAPTDWSEPGTLEHVSNHAPDPTALHIADLREDYQLGSCYTFTIGHTDTEVPCTDGEEAFSRVHHKTLLHEIAACGSYEVTSVFYAGTVGGITYDTAEWIVVITGTAPDLSGREFVPLSP